MSKMSDSDLYLQLTHEHKRQTSNWHSIINLIKEIHLKKYNHKEIREINIKPYEKIE